MAKIVRKPMPEGNEVTMEEVLGETNPAEQPEETTEDLQDIVSNIATNQMNLATNQINSRDYLKIVANRIVENDFYNPVSQKSDFVESWDEGDSWSCRAIDRILRTGYMDDIRPSSSKSMHQVHFLKKDFLLQFAFVEFGKEKKIFGKIKPKLIVYGLMQGGKFTHPIAPEPFEVKSGQFKGVETPCTTVYLRAVPPAGIFDLQSILDNYRYYTDSVLKVNEKHMMGTFVDLSNSTIVMDKNLKDTVYEKIFYPLDIKPVDFDALKNSGNLNITYV